MSIIFKPVKVSRFDIPLKRTDIWSTDGNGKTTVFGGTDGLKSYDLNLISTFIWRLCDGDHSIENIASLIGKLFKHSSNEDQVIENCVQLIQNFQDYGLIYIEDPHEL